MEVQSESHLTKSVQSEPNQTARLIPVTKWRDHHEWPPEGGLRHLIFHEETNGFATAFKRVGRRVLIDEAEFFRCVDRQNAQIS